MNIKGKTLSVIIILLIIFGSLGAVGKNLNDKNDSIAKDFVEGEVIVGFYKELENLNFIDVKEIDSFQGYYIKNKIEVLNVAVIKVNNGEEKSFIKSVVKSPYVKYAELNVIFTATFKPNDPRWDAQWGPQRIHCMEAWDTQQGSNSVKIAIIDTGVDYTHEDISTNYVTGGYDWVNNDNDPKDDNDHGTHCAGIAAARINNNIGIAGVAGKCKIMAEKVLDSGGSGSSSDLANAITHAADNGADIISMSLSSSIPSQTVKNACNYAYNSKEVLIVAAAGNDGNYGMNYPAGFDTVIAVGAIDNTDHRCSFSNYGESLELVAPGKRVISTIIGDDYDFFSGTSMATPHVAGVAALAKSSNPSWTNEQIRNELKDTAEDLGPSGWDDDFGYGLVDARLSGGMQPGADIEITVHKVKALDSIDSWPEEEAEWYYKLSVDSQSRFEYDGYEEQFLFWWIFHWNSRDTWTPDKTYSFVATNPEVSIKIKLMDDDVDFNDIADLSEQPSDDFMGGEEGRTFTVTYDLSDDGITGDRYETDGDWLYTRGDWDGSTEPEGILTGYKQDDAQLWFQISDDYDPEDYEPKLDVSPTSINFGTVKEGEVVSAYFTVENIANENDPFNPPQKLNWNIESPPSWMSINKYSGSLEPGEEESVIVEVDTEGMEHRTWTGVIKVKSNGGNQDITVTVAVPRVKSKFLAFYNFLELLEFRFPLLYMLIESSIIS